jgi:hypothetical protein
MGKRTTAIEPFPDDVRYLVADLDAHGWKDDVEIYVVGLADSPKLV